MRWDYWVGQSDWNPVFWSKTLFGLKNGFHIAIHKMVAADNVECFHTHDAYCWRLVLWGGYVEQVEPKFPGSVKFVCWRPLSSGIIKPAFSHRVHRLLNGRVSYSLWVHGPTVAKVETRGAGWQKIQL